VRACNLHTWEAEAGESQVQGQLGLHGEILSPTTTTTNSHLKVYLVVYFNTCKIISIFSLYFV
jgi:hypothetical protein